MKTENRRIAIIVFSLLVLGTVVYFLSDIVGYVIIAWVLSMVGQPIMNLFLKIKIGKKIRMGRIPAAILTLISFIIGIGLLVMIFVPLIIEQANNLRNVQYDQIYETLSVPISTINQKLIDLGIVTSDQLSSENFIRALSDWFKPDFISNFIGNIFSIAGNILIGIFSVLFIAFFFLREKNLFTNFIKAMVPDEYEADTEVVIEDISRMLRKYFGGIILQILCITAFVSILLWIFGIQNALLIAFFAAIINVIPYVGPFIGALFGLFITVSSNLNVDFYEVLSPLMIKVVIVFAVMQLVDNFILQPFIYSNSVKAHPLEIFIIILVAAKVGGILGMILAIPTYTVIRVIAKEFLNQFKIVQKLTGSM
ncbi:AI-2E family transporter [Portibacter lacus]|uniref:AI-2E family transporter n=1 Tax=Portibacter lacus TaxID=1099794 RepID=A0AA37SS51_9BACT|nr:AI-2E family transporter [Portibacter lacus]GLR17811.1 AI-2E family transporter [Portibacter lacus]